jgi:hypothetical protein
VYFPQAPENLELLVFVIIKLTNTPIVNINNAKKKKSKEESKTFSITWKHPFITLVNILSETLLYICVCVCLREREIVEREN